MRLKDRVAMVTGAARGIGQAYCLALAREGANIVAVDILSCAETVAQVQQAGGQALGVTADVANTQSTQAMAVQTLQRFGRIDILVNNAAIYPLGDCGKASSSAREERYSVSVSDVPGGLRWALKA